ncbi:MAG: hypothetical protein HY225_03205 [Candidatus Vogelbacteria bacterium]|nr:hypothetical protein [Candidatus Vogelbacteria bacterium]
MSFLWDDISCDFPGCGKEYDKRDGKRVAIVKDGEIMCFCAEHCKVLASKGVKLQVHREVLDELEDAKYAEGDRRLERERDEFIKSLKVKSKK